MRAVILHELKKQRKAGGWWATKWKIQKKKMQVKLFGMENSVWNQKYANKIKSKLDIAGKKGHLIANKNSEMRNRRKRMNENPKARASVSCGAATDSLESL